MPVQSERARRDRIQQALTVRVNNHPQPTQSLPWHDSTRLFPVVEIPLDYVVLNHESHRIQAQLAGHPQQDLVRADPESEEAQALIADIIRGLRGYEELKQNLNQEGQREAGVITDAGKLVNANRRAVAARELGKEYITVAVLEDAGAREIDLLELKLQVQKTFLEPYTFANELLFVKDLITKYSYSARAAALQLGWAASDSQREITKGIREVEIRLTILDMIEPLIEESHGRIRYTDFDDKEQSLKELAERVMAAEDGPERRRLIDIGVVGVVAGLGYLRMRQVSAAAYLEDHFVPLLEEDDSLGRHRDEILARAEPPATNPPGLDILDDEPNGDIIDPAGLRAAVTTAFREGEVTFAQGGNPITWSRALFVAELRKLMEEAAENQRHDETEDTRLRAPIDYAKQARQKVRKARELFQRVATRSDFNLGEMEQVVRKLAKDATALREEVAAVHATSGADDGRA